MSGWLDRFFQATAERVPDSDAVRETDVSMEVTDAGEPRHEDTGGTGIEGVATDEVLNKQMEEAREQRLIEQERDRTESKIQSRKRRAPWDEVFKMENQLMKVSSENARLKESLTKSNQALVVVLSRIQAEQNVSHLFHEAYKREREKGRRSYAQQIGSMGMMV